jgi:hypothetical protein
MLIRASKIAKVKEAFEIEKTAKRAAYRMSVCAALTRKGA